MVVTVKVTIHRHRFDIIVENYRKDLDFVDGNHPLEKLLGIKIPNCVEWSMVRGSG